MNLQPITKSLTIDRLVHAVMITFALVSLGNISSFMRAAHGTELVAWALGAALGAVLVATAVMLTRIDRTQDREAFWTLAVIVGVCAVLSGTIQFWAYSAHLPTYQAVVFGFGLPIVGEALLAYGAAIFHEAERRRRIRMATEGTTEAVAGAVAEALADVDVTKVRKYVERRVDGLTRAIVDGVIDDLMPKAPHVATLHVEGTDAVETAEFAQIRQSEPAQLDVANDKRSAQVAANKATLVDLLTDKGPQSVSAIADALGVHRDTARRYLNELADEGRVANVNRKWQVVEKAGEASGLTLRVPQPIAMSANGHSTAE